MASRIIAAVALALSCGCYKYHDEIEDATLDAEMCAWLEKHGFRISYFEDCWSDTAIHIEKRKGAKDGE